jgi:prephenate dehydrogenase
MAAALNGAKPEWLNLIGQGFKDMTRIADSDSNLWQEILNENSTNITQVLSKVRKELERIESNLSDPKSAKEIIENGNQGRTIQRVCIRACRVPSW